MIKTPNPGEMITSMVGVSLGQVYGSHFVKAHVGASQRGYWAYKKTCSSHLFHLAPRLVVDKIKVKLTVELNIHEV